MENYIIKWSMLQQMIDMDDNDIDKFAKNMGYKDLSDLASKISPKNLYHKDSNLFSRVLLNISRKAGMMPSLLSIIQGLH